MSWMLDDKPPTSFVSYLEQTVVGQWYQLIVGRGILDYRCGSFMVYQDTLSSLTGYQNRNRQKTKHQNYYYQRTGVITDSKLNSVTPTPSPCYYIHTYTQQQIVSNSLHCIHTKKIYRSYRQIDEIEKQYELSKRHQSRGIYWLQHLLAFTLALVIVSITISTVSVTVVLHCSLLTSLLMFILINNTATSSTLLAAGQLN